MFVIKHEDGCPMGARATCRRCSDCEGLDHHWIEDTDDDTGEPVMVCKHCEATRPWTDEDEDEGQDDG